MQLPEFTNIYAGITDAAHAAHFVAKLEEEAHVTLPDSATTGTGQQAGDQGPVRPAFFRLADERL